MIPECLVNECGDLVCLLSRCGTNIMTPDGMKVQPGVGECPVCGEKFLVTDEIADTANERWEKAYGSESR